MNSLKKLPYLFFVLVMSSILLAQPLQAGDGHNSQFNDHEPVVTTEFDNQQPTLLASARHYKRHQRSSDHYGTPQGRAYGYYDKRRNHYDKPRHYRPRHPHKFKRHDYTPYRYGYPALRHYRAYPAYGSYGTSYGVKVCVGGHDGFFCFNGRGY
jgi:hypothetical protein